MPVQATASCNCERSELLMSRSSRARTRKEANMNARVGLSCVIFAVLGSVQACGDDEDGGAAGSGGSGSGGTSAGAGASAASGNGGSGTVGVGDSGRGGVFEMQMCPPEEPANASTCTPARGDCSYGDRICDCLRESMTWACWNPADCPNPAPAERAACDPVGMECSYGGGDSCDCTATAIARSGLAGTRRIVRPHLPGMHPPARSTG
jgi:hypothetical protein